MRILPSTPAAIVCGAIITPLSLRGMKFIEAHQWDRGLVFLWMIATFFSPIAIATMDFKIFSRDDSGLCIPFAEFFSSEIFQQFYVPTWKRMFVWFLSTGVAVFSLKAIGVHL
jgi:hypothetical protein